MGKWRWEVGKRDLGYAIAIVLLFVALSISLRQQSDDRLVSHVSLGSALVSIVLALVAIFYTILHASKSQETLSSIRGVSQELKSRADTVATEGKRLRETQEEASKKLAEAVKGEMQEKTEGEVSAAVDTDVPLELGIDWASPRGLLILYVADLGGKSGKPCSPSQVAELQADPGESPALKYCHGYMMGLETGTGGRISFGTAKNGWDVVVSPAEQVLLSKVPAEIDIRINEYNMSKKENHAEIATWLSASKLRTERYLLSEDQDAENAPEESGGGSE